MAMRTYEECLRIAWVHELAHELAKHNRLHGEELGHNFGIPHCRESRMVPSLVENKKLVPFYHSYSFKEREMKRTRLQHLAERAMARAYGVSVEEVQAMVDNPDDKEARLAGMGSAVWMTFLMQMLQLLMEMMGDCQARPALFAAVRRPNVIARAVVRNRAQRIFAKGNAKLANMDTAAVAALEEEASAMEDDEIVAVVSEVQNPNPYMLV